MCVGWKLIRQVLFIFVTLLVTVSILHSVFAANTQSWSGPGNVSDNSELDGGVGRRQTLLNIYLGQLI